MNCDEIQTLLLAHARKEGGEKELDSYFRHHLSTCDTCWGVFCEECCKKTGMNHDEIRALLLARARGEPAGGDEEFEPFLHHLLICEVCSEAFHEECLKQDIPVPPMPPALRRELGLDPYTN